MSGKAEFEKLGRTPTSSSLYGMTVNICDAWGAKIEKSGEEEQVLAQDMNASQFAAVGQEKRVGTAPATSALALPVATCKHPENGSMARGGTR